MKSSNPIFSRRGFDRPAGAGSAGDHLVNPYAGVGGSSLKESPTVRMTMTMDDVIVRTAATLGTVVLTAALSWVLLPVDQDALGRSYGIAVTAAVTAFVLSLVQTFKRTPSPALILGYAAFEGVFLGVISDTTSTYVAPGVIVQAVLGTFAVFAGVLIAYRMRWIRVTRRFFGFVLASATGFLLLTAVDLLFSAFGAGNGLGLGSGGLGVVFGVAGVLLGACFLALDFKQVEDAIAYGAAREESWLAAFGLTATLVWIYLEALRVLTILRDDT
ncbi:Bax inhibitor-1/YccA family protein (plasmid) [Streptomyces sp. NBC_01340]|uniref:Bax inhibitor-1/YccA family protein n=1 Tax=unclassified Streptomyces TaxID=2593676 RepID=UPI00224CD175|nr:MULTISPECIES: Bax inhibitor-1/YccA family protein [unclassified Streptomyces]MCX4460555.1 Bax inhibitor-1/YccA family protein [Streptomyces sp. NBC_01719]MCX4500115.1 Bax inhibitor-1/YccA family protein [Streptomyces sp. NBC_01728]MCX4597859.1 Bax inhibitor-1/YccA family protein [Streptomyces sp. NBC_01549]WSI45201.1 Bax inhibitor-1/YccA family protein [Streptomyces sp. NBC_01340]